MKPNPLSKYLNQSYVQPPLKPRVAQYLLKALDYLHIYSQKNNEPALIEQELHEEAEGLITDVIIYAPEENDGETQK
jgi:hypothetical protein